MFWDSIKLSIRHPHIHKLLRSGVGTHGQHSAAAPFLRRQPLQCEHRLSKGNLYKIRNPQCDDYRSKAPTSTLTLCPMLWSIQCRALERCLENCDCMRTIDAIREGRTSKITGESQPCFRRTRRRCKIRDAFQQFFRSCKQLARPYEDTSPKIHCNRCESVCENALKSFGQVELSCLWCSVDGSKG